jgi:hypothetical protein
MSCNVLSRSVYESRETVDPLPHQKSKLSWYPPIPLKCKALLMDTLCQSSHLCWSVTPPKFKTMLIPSFHQTPMLCWPPCPTKLQSSGDIPHSTNFKTLWSVVSPKLKALMIRYPTKLQSSDDVHYPTKLQRSFDTVLSHQIPISVDLLFPPNFKALLTFLIRPHSNPCWSHCPTKLQGSVDPLPHQKSKLCWCSRIPRKSKALFTKF